MSILHGKTFETYFPDGDFDRAHTLHSSIHTFLSEKPNIRNRLLKNLTATDQNIDWLINPNSRKASFLFLETNQEIKTMNIPPQWNETNLSQNFIPMFSNKLKWEILKADTIITLKLENMKGAGAALKTSLQDIEGAVANGNFSCLGVTTLLRLIR